MVKYDLRAALHLEAGPICCVRSLKFSLMIGQKVAWKWMALPGILNRLSHPFHFVTWLIQVENWRFTNYSYIID